MKVTNRLQLLALGLCIAGTAIAAPDVLNCPSAAGKRM